MKNKKYKTRDGRNARIICDDAKGDYPLVWLVDDGGSSEDTVTTTQNFKKYKNDTEPYIIEVSPYIDWEIDRKVMVRNYNSNCWYRGYYAGLYDGSKPTTWEIGQTRWTVKNNERCIYDEVREPTDEELGDIK